MEEIFIATAPNKLDIVTRTETGKTVVSEASLLLDQLYAGGRTNLNGTIYVNGGNSPELQHQAQALQFVTSLYKRDESKQYKIRSIIQDTTKHLSDIKAVPQVGEIDPGTPQYLITLSMIKGNADLFSSLTSFTQTRINQTIPGLLTACESYIAQVQRTGDVAPYMYHSRLANKYMTPHFAPNIPLLCAGALGVYANVVAKGMYKRNEVANISNMVIKRAIQQLTETPASAHIAIGGQNKAVRKPFGSSGYNSFSAEGLSLAAYATLPTKTGNLESQPSSVFTKNANMIAQFYLTQMKEVLEANVAVGELHFPGYAGSVGADGTSMEDLVVKAYNHMVYDKTIELSSKLEGANTLIGRATPYLFNMMWTDLAITDKDFLTILCNKLLATKEVSAVSGVSVMRQSALLGKASTPRTLSGFSALLERDHTRELPII